MCIATIAFMMILTKLKIDIIISAYLLSFGLSYVFYYAASLLTSITISIPTIFIKGNDMVDGPPNFNRPIYILLYTLIFILQFLLSFFFFRIKRFKRGFPFIFRKFTIVISLFFTGIIVIFATWLNRITKSGNYTDRVITGYLYIIGVLISGIGIYILIRRHIKMVQRNRMQQKWLTNLEEQLREKEEETETINQNLIIAREIFHDLIHKIITIQEAYNKDLTLDDIENLAIDFDAELAKIKSKSILTSTNIHNINNLFSYFEKEFSKDGITFKIIINGSINYMIEHIIKQNLLETLIGDHLKDAQIAINAGNSTFRSILSILGIKDDYYEFTVFDSGIPFEVDTLMRLGTERVTTHGNNGGSGIGFMTTFDTLQECSASLIIKEWAPSPSNYTKSITIRFDNQHRYIIKTYRSDAFLPSDRYTIIHTSS
jgi:hypothetical protein